MRPPTKAIFVRIAGSNLHPRNTQTTTPRRAQITKPERLTYELMLRSKPLKLGEAGLAGL